MPLDGVRHTQGDSYDIFYVDSFSDHMKDVIRADLATICHGPRFAAIGLGLHTYEKTVAEFYRRYSAKAENTKTGMIGELLAHITIRYNMPHMKPISILLNPNESSIKKGFDLNFIKDHQPWYGEVKSSRVIEDINVDNGSLLTDAKTTLLASFNTPDLRTSLWTSAMFEAAIMFDRDELTPIGDLLNDSYEDLQQRHSTSANVVLISVPFHDIQEAQLGESELVTYIERIRAENAFNNVSVVCIQKSLFSAVETFLRQEAEASS